MPKTKRKSYQVILNQYAFESIHQLILVNNNPNQIIRKLGVTSAAFNAHIGKFNHAVNQDKRCGVEFLTFDFLKSLSKDNAKQLWGTQYTQPLDLQYTDLNQLSRDKIIRAIQSATSPGQAAGLLGVSPYQIYEAIAKQKITQKELSNRAIPNPIINESALPPLRETTTLSDSDDDKIIQQPRKKQVVSNSLLSDSEDNQCMDSEEDIHTVIPLKGDDTDEKQQTPDEKQDEISPISPIANTYTPYYTEANNPITQRNHNQLNPSPSIFMIPPVYLSAFHSAFFAPQNRVIQVRELQATQNPAEQLGTTNNNTPCPGR